MTARRLTTLIYLLLLLSVLAHVAVNVAAMLGYDISAITYGFVGHTESATHNGELTHYQRSGVYYTWLSLPFTLAALALILWQRNKHPMYYADHMKWQLNSLLGYGVSLLLMAVSILLFLFVYLAMPFLFYVLPVVLEGWLFYRVLRGFACLGKGQSVYHDGAPMPAENS